LATGWDWTDLELFLVVGVVVVDLACACGGGAVAEGGAGRVTEVAGLVVVSAMVPMPAAAAARREELGGEAREVDLLWASGVEVAPWVGGLQWCFGPWE